MQIIEANKTIQEARSKLRGEAEKLEELPEAEAQRSPKRRRKHSSK
jgi:hypothetical protein